MLVAVAFERFSETLRGTADPSKGVATAIARACIRDGARGRFFNVFDLVNRLEMEARAGRAERMAHYLSRLDFIVLNELGYLPFAQFGGQLLVRTDIDPGHYQPCLRRMPTCSATPG